VEATVDLAVIHNTLDPEEWKMALAVDQEFLSGFTIRSFVEAADGDRAYAYGTPPAKPNFNYSAEERQRTLGEQ
jgi:hypothetical protein